MVRSLFGLGERTPAVSVAEAQRRQTAGALVVDVRERDEWQSGHIPGARHIPLGELGRRAGELPRDRELLIICRSGNRSGIAAAQLRAAGFEQAYNVSGGMLSWSAAGLPVRTGRA